MRARQEFGMVSLELRSTSRIRYGVPGTPPGEPPGLILRLGQIPHHLNLFVREVRQVLGLDVKVGELA